jgi:hypothetical protein
VPLEKRYCVCELGSRLGTCIGGRIEQINIVPVRNTGERNRVRDRISVHFARPGEDALELEDDHASHPLPFCLDEQMAVDMRHAFEVKFKVSEIPKRRRGAET